MADQSNNEIPINLSEIDAMPVGMNAVENFYRTKLEGKILFEVRAEVMRRIEKETGHPLICYVTQTDGVSPELGQVLPIQDSDLEGFDQLIDTTLPHSTNGTIDVFLVSNGGSPEAAERIVRLLRANFEKVRFILPANAYSAATMMSFACDEVLMTDTATLGPIDPQINGIPARAILRGMEDLERRVKDEGPEALAAYIHLLQGYSLHLIEICKDAEELSKELARNWLSEYMLKCSIDDQKVSEIVSYFASYDIHKSHSRSIGSKQAITVGLKITELKRGTVLSNLVRSLYDQSKFLLNNSPFLKLFENAHGTAWGRQGQIQQIRIPGIPANLPQQ